MSLENKALENQWSTLSSTIDDSNLDEFCKLFNDTLRSSTFASGNELTKADTEIFDKLAPVLAKNSDKTVQDGKWVVSNRHVARWVDLMQHKHSKGDAKLQIVKDIEFPIEVQAKPKKKESAEGKDKKEGDKKAAPAAPAAAAAAGAAAGSKKGQFTPEELAKLREEKAAAKAAKKAAAAKSKEAQPAAAAAVPVPSQIDLRVGFIEKAIKHPNADSLYVSTMNVGEEEPRTICSGLVNYYKLEEMQQRYVVVVCNLKKVKMRGIDSMGMVLCASSNGDDEKSVEFVTPPEGSKPGDKIFFEGFNGTPEKVMNPKKKIWETLQPHFSTNEDKAVFYKDNEGKVHKLVNEKGQEFKCASIVNAIVR